MATIRLKCADDIAKIRVNDDVIIDEDFPSSEPINIVVQIRSLAFPNTGKTVTPLYVLDAVTKVERDEADKPVVVMQSKVE